jgi:hypothetical protein
MEEVRDQAKEMVRVLRPTLRLHGNSLAVLEKLAEKPCSLRLCDGDSWKKIEKDLNSENSKEVTNKVQEEILKHVDMCTVDECDSLEEWASAVSEDVAENIETIITESEKLLSSHRILWDRRNGCPVRC